MPPHNSYVHILMTTGVFGLAAAMLFLFRILADGWRVIWSGKGKPQELASFLAVTMLLVMCMFETDVFLQVRPGAFIFWIAAGYLSAYLSEREKCKDTLV
jgi:O-antigen ligase